MTPPYVFFSFLSSRIRSLLLLSFSVAAVSVFSFISVLYALTGLLWSLLL